MDDNHHRAAEVAAGAAKSFPPVAASSLILLGRPLSEWVLILTFVWLCLQIGGWVYDRFLRDRVAEWLK